MRLQLKPKTFGGREEAAQPQSGHSRSLPKSRQWIFGMGDLEASAAVVPSGDVVALPRGRLAQHAARRSGDLVSGRAGVPEGGSVTVTLLGYSSSGRLFHWAVATGSARL